MYPEMHHPDDCRAGGCEECQGHEPSECPNRPCDDCCIQFVQVLPAQDQLAWFLNNDDTLQAFPLIGFGLLRNSRKVVPLAWFDNEVSDISDMSNLIDVRPRCDGPPHVATVAHYKAHRERVEAERATARETVPLTS